MKKKRILKTFQCANCEIVFASKYGRKRHICSVHEENKSEYLQYRKYFTNKGNLKIHIESVHERKNCDLCGDEFSSNIKDMHYCVECFEKNDKIIGLETAYNVEYIPKFFERDHSPVFLPKPKKDTVSRNSVSPTDYEISESDDKDKSSESNIKDKNKCVECI